jgi:hypothetical protein
MHWQVLVIDGTMYLIWNVCTNVTTVYNYPKVFYCSCPFGNAPKNARLLCSDANVLLGTCSPQRSDTDIPPAVTLW